jgi:hypothetical protein
MRRAIARRDERGVTLLFMAIAVFLTLGMAAMAIDYGMIKTQETEAQRAMDSAALAGASAFMESGTNAVHTGNAIARAKDFATKNKVGGQAVTVGEIDSVPVDVTKERVDVYWHRNGIRTWFANTFGISTMGIASHAAAVAAVGGVETSCLKPFLIPDIWQETNIAAQDKNSSRAIDGSPLEVWSYEPPGSGGSDRYLKYDPNARTDSLALQTGYGSAWRSNLTTYPSDKGLPMTLKPQLGNDPNRHGNWYYLLDGPEPNTEQQIAGGCITAGIGDTPTFKPGGTTGGVKNGVKDLVKLDPGATWNDATHTITGSSYPGETSPRVIIVGLFDPIFIKGANKNNKPDAGVVFNNFAKIFLQPANGNDDVTARFIGFIPGGGGGVAAGTLVKVPRLVE